MIGWVRKYMAALLAVIMLIQLFPATLALAEGDMPAPGGTSVDAGMSGEPGETGEDKIQRGSDQFVLPNSGPTLPITPDAGYFVTYIFQVDGVEYARQIISNGEELVIPAAPVQPSRKFIGWFSSDDTPFTGFGPQTVSVSAEVTVNAKFADVQYVFFMDTGGRVFATKEGVSGNVIDITDIALPPEAGKQFAGWNTAKNGSGTYITGSVTLGDSDLRLFPVFGDGHWVEFDSLGGSHRAPMYLIDGQNTSAPADPERFGFTFTGWYTAATGGALFAFGQPLTGDITLYARWQGAPVAVTVAYWFENADIAGNPGVNPDNYSYSSSQTLTDPAIVAGMPVSALSAVASPPPNAVPYGVPVAGFYSDNTTDGLIAGDGSTIVNLYYRRNTYTLTFTMSKGTISVPGGVQKASSYSFSAKYGESISSRFPWPSNGSGITFDANPEFRYWIGNGTDLTTSYARLTGGLVPTSGLTATFQSHNNNGGSDIIVQYWFERLLGETGGTNVSGKYYILQPPLTHTYQTNNPPTPATAMVFEGLAAPPVMSKSGSTYNFYYTRQRFSLNFDTRGGSSITDKPSLMHGEPLDGYQPSAVPTKNDPVSGSPMAFGGWYNEPSCLTAFDWNSTMPMGGITAYAKWSLQDVTVTAHLNMEGSETPATFTVPYGSKIDEAAQMPVSSPPAGMPHPVWRGWCTKENGAYIPLSFKAGVYSDVELWPYWTSGQSFQVTYHGNGGAGDAPVDNSEYADGSCAKILDATGLAAPAGKCFLGWNTAADGSGDAYQPNAKVLVSGPITLYAQWGNLPERTSITYYGNGGTMGSGGDSVTEHMENNALHTTKPAGTFTRANFVLTGWNTAANGSGTPYDFNVDVRVNKAQGPNELYAQWSPAKYTITASVENGIITPSGTATVAYLDNQQYMYAPRSGYEIASVKVDGVELTGIEKITALTGIYTFTAVQANRTIHVTFVPRSDLTYAVHYYLDGTTDSLAVSETRTGQTMAGTVTEDAKSIPGYTADEAQKSLTLAASGNEIIFRYMPNTDLTYNVHYYLAGSTDSLAASATRTGQTMADMVTEDAIPIAGYTADAARKILTLAALGNVIIFYYTPNSDITYDVHYYLDGTAISLAPSAARTGQTMADVAAEDAISIAGYTVDEARKSLKLAADDNQIIFYYTPNTDIAYDVHYYLAGTMVSLATSATRTDQTMADTVTEAAITIPGYTADAAQKSLELAADGSQIIFYYTPNSDITYDVHYYLDGTADSLATSATRTGQTMADTVTENAAAIAGYTAIEAGKSLTLAASGNQIIFYYTPNTDIAYDVHYYLDGTTVSLAVSETRTGQTMADTVREDAATIAGYTADEASKSLTLAASGNQIIFHYTPNSDLTYNVHYYLAGTADSLAASATRTDRTMAETVTEDAIPIAGYTADEASKSLTLAVSGNVIIFFYTPNTDLTYDVHYYLDGTTDSLAASETRTGRTMAETVAEDAISIAGYTVDEAGKSLTLAASGNEIVFYYMPNNDIAYDVHYYLDGTADSLAPSQARAGQTMADTVTEDAVTIAGYTADAASKSLILAASGNEIIFRYTPNTDLTYDVHYFLDGTTDSLAASETRTGQTMANTVTETAAAIAGYTADEASKSLTLAASGNEIIFRYTPNTDLVYDVHYYLDGTTDSLAVSETRTGQTMAATVTEDAIPIAGYTVDEDQKSLTLAAWGNEIIFRYTPNTDLAYDVHYYLDGTTDSLASSATRTGRTMAETVIEDAIPIAGYTVDGSVKSLKLAAENNEIIFYYTPNDDIAYDVHYYLNNTTISLALSATRTGRTMADTATEDAIPIAGYTADEASKSLKLAADGNRIVFYYTPNTDLTYDVHYYLDGTTTPLETSVTRVDQTMAETVTEDAVTIAGYTVDEASKSLKLAADGNEITFRYTPNKDIAYDVRYYLVGTTDSLAPSATRTGQTMADTVTENAATVAGYTADAARKSLTLAASGNVILFYYTPNTDLTYDVHYYLDGTATPLGTSVTRLNQIMASRVTEDAAAIAGYTADEDHKSLVLAASGNEIIFYYTPNTDLTYDVHYYLDGTTDSLAPSATRTGQIMADTVTEDAIAIAGYTAGAVRKSLKLAADGNEIIFYYTPNTDLAYDVHYYLDGTTDSLAPSAARANQKMASTVTEIAATIAGYTVDEAMKSLVLAASGNEIIFYYTPNTDLTYDVHYYLNGTTDSLAPSATRTGQTMADTVSENAEAIAGYTADEARKSLTLAALGNVILFYYTPNTNLTYDVHYYLDGTTDSLAASETRTGQTMASTVSENAAIIAGYTADVARKSLTLAASGNEIIFYYTPKTNLTYDVHYYLDGTETPLVQSATRVNQTMASRVTEDAAAIAGYTADEGYKSLILAASDNEIIFYYTPNTDLTYDVHYYLDGTATPLAPSATRAGQTMASTVYENAPVIPGYTADGAGKSLTLAASGNEVIFYYTPNANLTYDVHYYLVNTAVSLTFSATRTGQIMASTVSENAVTIPGYTADEVSKSLTLAASGNVLIFYYTPNSDIEYDVHYYLDGTADSLATSETRTDNTMASTVTENAKTIAGYTVDEASKSLTLAASGNEILFYYTPNANIAYDVHYYLEGTADSLAASATRTGQTMAATVSEIAPAIPGYTADEAEKTLTLAASGNVLTFYYIPNIDISYDVHYYLDGTMDSLAQSITRLNQKMADTVAENAITISGYTADATPKSLTLAASDNQIIFYYTPNTDLTYDVHYYLAGTMTSLAASATRIGNTMADTVTESAPVIPGYTADEAAKSLILEALGNEIIFYYTPNTNLTYVVHYYLINTTDPLALSATRIGQTMADTVTEIAPVIPGYTADSTRKSLTLAASGNVLTFYYTPNTDIEYDVHYYLDGSTDSLAPSATRIGNTMADTVAEIAPAIPGYTVDEARKSLTLAASGNEIVFYYTPNTDIEYDVHYHLTGTADSLALSVTRTGQTMADTVTENALVIPGYTADESEKSLVLAASGNVLTFHYTPNTDIAYDVHYYLAGTMTPLATSAARVDQIMANRVTEDAIPIAGYTVDATPKSLTLAASGNVLTFYYTPNSDLTYDVHYYLADTTDSLARSVTRTGQVMAATVAENALVIPGYTVDEALKSLTLAASGNAIIFSYTPNNNLTYDVHYYLAGTTNSLALSATRTGQTMADTVTENAPAIPGYTADETRKSLTLEASGNVLAFYYMPNNDIAYDVHYYLAGTATTLAPSAARTGKTMASEVTEYAATIPGYTVDEPDKSLILAASGNAIIFYYTPNNDLTYDVHYYLAGTATPLALSATRTGQTMAETVTEDAAAIPGYTADEADKSLVLAASGNQIVFYYTPNTDIMYDVHYYLAGAETPTPLEESKTVTGKTMAETVVETAAVIPGYTVDNVQKSLKLEATGNVLTFHYTPNTDIAYAVHYYLAGTTDSLAASATRTGQTMASTVTENAATIPGYTADMTRKSLTLAASGNEIVFHYTPNTNISYDVHYYLEGTTTPLATSETRTGRTMASEATEHAPAIPGYTADEAEKTLTLAAWGSEIIFYYTPNTDIEYDVHYYLTSTTDSLAPSATRAGQTMASTVTEYAEDIPGYTADEAGKSLTLAASGNVLAFYYTPKTDIAYDVHYYLGGTTTPLAASVTRTGQTMASQVAEDAAAIEGYTVDADSKSLTLAASGNQIIFIYAPRTDLSYTVKYVEYSTNHELAPAKEETGQTFGTEVTEYAVDLTSHGFDTLGPTFATITIAVHPDANVITFYYEARGYVVHYDTTGGTPDFIQPTVVEYGHSNLLPQDDPTKSGYSFAGWYLAETGGARVTGTDRYRDLVGNNALTMSATLYARWTERADYTVRYHANGGTLIASPDHPSSPGITWTQSGLLPPSAPAPAMRTGYVLTGWNTLANGTGVNVTASTPYSQLTASDSALEVTLYAQWQARTYTVTFNSNDSNGVPTSAANPNPASKTVTFDAQYGSLATTTRNGYVFSGWYLEDTCVTPVTAGATVSIADNHTLYANWTARADIVVSFNANSPVPVGGDSLASRNVTFNAPYGAPNPLPMSTRTGYTFNGWYTASSGGSRVEDTASVLNWNNHTLYARWTANPVTVNFYLNHYAGDATLHAGRPGLYDDPVPGISAPSRAGYTFGGWFNAAGDKQYYPGTSIIDVVNTLNLYARWTPLTYPITYLPGAAETVANMPSNTSWVFDDQGGGYTLAPQVPVRTGYTFDGWSHGGNTYQPLFTVPLLPPGSVTFTAQWAEKDIYTVHYDANGGISVPLSIPSATNVRWTQRNLLPAAAITRLGHTLIGWQAAADNGGTGIDVAAGNPYSALVADDNVTEMTLFAQWEPNKYDVTYVVTGHNPTFDFVISNSTPPNLPNTAFGTLLTVGDEPTLAGYTFSGWAAADASGTVSTMPGTSFTMPDNPVTFMGELIPIDYTVSYSIIGEVPPGFTVPEAATYHAGDIVSVPMVERTTDYRFSGWTYMYNNRLRKATGWLTMPAGDIVLEGQFARRSSQLGDLAVPLAGGAVGLKNIPVGYSLD